jgi:hypothetical protein
MPQTPDRHPGPLFLEPDSADADGEGIVTYYGGSIRAYDSLGVYDVRHPDHITEGQHRNLDTLAHFLDEDSYTEVSYTSGKPASATTWTTSGKTLKIRESLLTYTGSLVTTVVDKQYDSTGMLKEQLTTTITYSGGKVVTSTTVKDT